MPINVDFLIPFLTISFLLAVTPGPSNAFLMAQTFAKGRNAGMQSAAGFAVAGVIHTIFAVLGLSAVLKASPQAYQIVLMMGASYLLYLGVMSIRDSLVVQGEASAVVNNKNGKNVFIQALLTEVLNPKVALFFIAFIPQFVDNSLTTAPAIQMAIFGLLYPIFALPIDLSYVHFGDKIASYFRGHPSAQQWLDRITGLIFIALAVSMLL